MSCQTVIDYCNPSIFILTTKILGSRFYLENLYKSGSPGWTVYKERATSFKSEKEALDFFIKAEKGENNPYVIQGKFLDFLRIHDVEIKGVCVYEIPC